MKEAVRQYCKSWTDLNRAYLRNTWNEAVHNAYLQNMREYPKFEYLGEFETQIEIF
jgi:hypothetical protein